MRIKYASNKSNKWTVDDDVRALRYDGEPIFYLDRVTDRFSIENADDLAEFIAFLLNEEGATPEKGPVTVIKP